jgi:glutathione S-transferase
MLKIWGRRNSSNVQKVLWTCVELDIAFDRIDWGGGFGGNRDPAYLALNPNGLVPVIEDEGFVLWESNTIIRYLTASRGGGRLYPGDPRRRALIERWMDWQLSALGPPMGALTFGFYRVAPDQRDPAVLEAAHRRGRELWPIVDRQLASADHLVGPELSLADICLGIYVHRWYSFPVERPLLPRLEAWYARLAERPGFHAHVAGPVT